MKRRGFLRGGPQPHQHRRQHLTVALGDLSYGTTGQEHAWCDFVTTRVGAGYPFELLVGNHESNGQIGNVNDCSACLPEPAAWQRSVTDSTAELQTAGHVGFSSYVSSSATKGPITIAVDQIVVTAP